MDTDPDITPSSSPHTRPVIAQSASRAQSLSTHRGTSTTPSPPPESSHGSTLSALPHNTAGPNIGHLRPSASSQQPPASQPSSEDNPSTESLEQSNRLPPLPPPTPRRHTQLQAIQKAVNAEKERFKKSDNRNVHLAQVRHLFSEIFQAPEDEDFYSNHVAARREEVDKYLDGEGSGPDTSDLRFTDQEPFNNAWNSAVCSHLAQELWNRQRTEQWTTKKGGRVVHASKAYWEDAIFQKFKQVRKGWMDAQHKVVQDPTTGRNRLESQEEAKTQRYDKGEETRTVARRRERRVKVRWADTPIQTPFHIIHNLHSDGNDAWKYARRRRSWQQHRSRGRAGQSFTPFSTS